MSERSKIFDSLADAESCASALEALLTKTEAERDEARECIALLRKALARRG